MIKGKPPVLFVLAGVVLLFTVAIFTFSRTMRENVRAMTSILPQKYDASSAKSSPNSSHEPGSLPPITNNQQEGTGMTTNTPPQINENRPANTPVYRNDEFGFEFTVPDNWKVEENPYSSPYSYFNLVLVPIDKKASYLDAFLINVVKPEFVEMSYRTLKPSDVPIVVDGVSGVKYEYVFEGSGSIDYILPRSHDTFLIGCQKEHSDIFNAVISSFKFLKDGSAESATDTPSPKSHGVFSGPALYQNDEFGFEFSIPDGWQAEENQYSTPNSYFNLTLEPTAEKSSYPDPVMINVAKSEFIASSYDSLKSFSKPVTISGATGSRYEYPFEGSENIDIILPRSQNTFVIGAWSKYKDTLNEVVSSFKFLK